MYIGDDTQQHLESLTLNHVALDVLCDVVEVSEHMKEIQCMEISHPQEVWLLYTSVCIISFGSASNILRSPEVRKRQLLSCCNHELGVGISMPWR